MVVITHGAFAGCSARLLHVFCKWQLRGHQPKVGEERPVADARVRGRSEGLEREGGGRWAQP